MELFIRELNRLVEDYEKCSSLLIKEQILQDIAFISEALALINQTDENTTIK